jgi:hypothetical protein
VRAIFIVMLCVQAALVVAAAVTVLTAKSNGARRRPYWSSLAVSLVIGAGASFQIADHHAADPVSRLLEYGSGLLLGMGLMCLLIQLRQRRGLDGAPA